MNLIGGVLDCIVELMEITIPVCFRLATLVMFRSDLSRRNLCDWPPMIIWSS
jgi:hypothetical protein